TEQVIDPYTRPELPEGMRVSLPNGKQESQRLTEMRRDAAEAHLLDACLTHQANMALFEVAKAAMQQARGPAARAAGEIGALDQYGIEPTQGGIPRAARPGDAAAGDQQVSRALRELHLVPTESKRL